MLGDENQGQTGPSMTTELQSYASLLFCLLLQDMAQARDAIDGWCWLRCLLCGCTTEVWNNTQFI